MVVKEDFKISVRSEYFNDLLSGNKKCEGKKISPTYENLEKDDMFSFVCEKTNRNFMAKIIDIHYYRSDKTDGYTPLRNYLLTEGINNCLPNVNSLEEAINEYLKFWKLDDIKEYGVMAIFFEVCK